MICASCVDRQILTQVNREEVPLEGDKERERVVQSRVERVLLAEPRILLFFLSVFYFVSGLTFMDGTVLRP